MTKDALSVIKRAEEEAAEITAKATEQARIMIADAEKRASDLKSNTEEDTAKELALTLGTMRKKAEELIEKSLDEAGAEAKRITEAAELRTLSAVKRLVSEITEA